VFINMRHPDLIFWNTGTAGVTVDPGVAVWIRPDGLTRIARKRKVI
jgi:hypothetical protein